MPGLRPAARLGPLVAGSMLLTACTTAVGVPAAPGAANPLCAQVIISLPDEVGEGGRRTTTSQSTAAWGEPAVVLRCGVQSPDATTDLCSTFDGVDWVLTELDGGRLYTTFGRDPGIAVTVPDAGQPPDVVLGALSPAASVVEQTRACL